MKNKNWVAMLLCGAMLLGGCGNSGTDTKEAVVEDVSAQEELIKEADIQENLAEKVDTSGASAENGSLVIEAGPDKPVYESGSLIYTLHDFKLYESPEDVSISEDKMVLEDARSYAARSKFLLMQVDIQNIDYQGDGNDGDGEMNLSLFTIAPKEQNESDEWVGSLPVYLSEPGQRASDYYHVFVKPGETRTIAVGFYVPVNDSEELRSQCRISLYGSMDEGYVYEIPKVQ